MVGLQPKVCLQFLYTNIHELTEPYSKQNSVWAKRPRIYQASWVGFAATGSALSCCTDSIRGYQTFYTLLLSFPPLLLT